MMTKYFIKLQKYDKHSKNCILSKLSTIKDKYVFKPLKRALSGSVRQIQTLNFNIYNINAVIIQTREYLFSP